MDEINWDDLEETDLIFNENGEVITDPDLTLGELGRGICIKPQAVDTLSDEKLAYVRDDYIIAWVYMLFPEESPDIPPIDEDGSGDTELETLKSQVKALTQRIDELEKK